MTVISFAVHEGPADYDHQTSESELRNMSPLRHRIRAKNGSGLTTKTGPTCLATG